MLCHAAPKREPGCGEAGYTWLLPGEGKAADVLVPMCYMHGGIAKDRGELVRPFLRTVIEERKRRRGGPKR